MDPKRTPGPGALADLSRPVPSLGEPATRVNVERGPAGQLVFTEVPPSVAYIVAGQGEPRYTVREG